MADNAQLTTGDVGQSSYAPRAFPADHCRTLGTADAASSNHDQSQVANGGDARLDSDFAYAAESLWRLSIDPLTMNEAVERIRGWISRGDEGCRFAVTPNIDHVVQLHRRPELLRFYTAASMTLADGWPLVTMSRLYGKPLPERVPGSDLLPALCDEYDGRCEALRLFLLGGKPGVPERAAANIESCWTAVSVVDCCSPPLGFDDDPNYNERLCDQINAAQPDVLVVGLGCPKQERWLCEYRDRLRVPAALAVGGTIDFLAGEQTRAPKWVQQIKMEWLHRLATNPRRLAKRYALDAIWFPWICVREFGAVD